MYLGDLGLKYVLRSLSVVLIHSSSVKACFDKRYIQSNAVELGVVCYRKCIQLGVSVIENVLDWVCLLSKICWTGCCLLSKVC